MVYKVLASDKLSQDGLKVLRDNPAFEVEEKVGLKPDELKAIIGEYDALLIRSGTKCTADLLSAAKKLKIIGRAGAGLDNVDLPAATQRGIIVMNTPGGNTIATCEQTMTLMLALSRNTAPANRTLREGSWERNKLQGVELFSKTLGLIGLGRIGTEVAKRSLAFGMTVLAYDPYVDKERMNKLGMEVATLEEIYAKADYISVHVPMGPETKGMIGKAQFALMKPTVRIINCARGGIVNEVELADALREGKIAGAAVDVYEQEPPAMDHPLLKLDNCLCTPHLGASTKEAQENVAVEVCHQVVDALTGKGVRNAANIPYIEPNLLETMLPYVELAEKLGLFAGQFLHGKPASLKVTTAGELSQLNQDYITYAVLIGLFSPHLDYTINFVNAPVVAKERGLTCSASVSPDTFGYVNLIMVELETGEGKLRVAGTVFGHNDLRIIRVNDFHLDAIPRGPVLAVESVNAPGVLCHISSVLAEQGINIEDMSLGRHEQGGLALTTINLNKPVTEDTLKKLTTRKEIHSARVLNLR